MRLLLVALALLLILVVLWESFETIVLPRRVNRHLRLTRVFYWLTWRPWAATARRVSDLSQRETWLGVYGPLSLILLLGLWATALVFGFGLLYFGLGVRVVGPDGPPSFVDLLYFSGSTFFTLGIGEFRTADPLGHLLTIVEAGSGLGFLAIVIGYLPVIYQSFSRREVAISQLDQRAGSPPCGAELLRRRDGQPVAELVEQLALWERWSADLLESHLSYPVLAYFRSQHERQSWLAALTAMLDLAALVSLSDDRRARYAAGLTFAMARHAAVDLSQIFGLRPCPPAPERLSAEALGQLRALLATTQPLITLDPTGEQRWSALRREYEPYVESLGRHLLLLLPPLVPPAEGRDDWQTVAEPGNGH